MKRLAAFVIALAMALMLVPVPTFAESAQFDAKSESAEAAFSVQAPSSVSAGEEFQVSVFIHGSYEISVMKLQLRFDSSVFEYISYQNGSVVTAAQNAGGISMMVLSTNGSSLNLGIVVPFSYVTAQGELYTATFRAKSDAPSGIYAFTPVIDAPADFAQCPPDNNSVIPIAHTETPANVEIPSEVIVLTAPVISISLIDYKPVITWNAVNGAANYEVYRAPKGGTYSLIGYSTTASYTDNADLTAGTRYYYKVRAVGASGNFGPYSNQVSVVAVSSLTAPQIAVSLVNDKPVITWSALNGASKYEVYRAPKGGTYSLIGYSTTASYTDNADLTAGTRYYYKVRAVGASGNFGPYSNQVSVVAVQQ